MAIYKALKSDGSTDAAAPAVVMVADGDAGKYNVTARPQSPSFPQTLRILTVCLWLQRANRSLTHFTETVP